MLRSRLAVTRGRGVRQQACQRQGGPSIARRRSHLNLLKSAARRSENAVIASLNSGERNWRAK